MKNKIYIIEGPDGTGKSTLANKIAEETKGHILHASYDKNWNIEKYHFDLIDVAFRLSKYQSVVLDRWAISEFVYGTVFRGGPSYDTAGLIEDSMDDKIVWIYCENEDAVKNHLANSKKRKEMFDDMTKVVEEFDDYVEYSSNNWLQIPWIKYNYNYNWINIDEFVKEVTR